MQKNILAALLSVKGHNLSDHEKYLFEKYNPLGVTLFARNLFSVEQTINLVKSIKETIGRNDVLIALDEEGGRVERLAQIGFDLHASQNILGLTDDKKITKLHARLIAANMKKIGANLNFAPVLDVGYSDITIALKNRCFGIDKEKIAQHGKILCEEYINEGICPCIKHIPGHGRAVNDPHKELSAINCSIDQLENDFYPFQQLKNMPMAMSAHILLTQIDNKNPITVSPKGIKEIIRDFIGFNGFLISDAIDMHALKGNIIQKAKASWQAGCDGICYCLADAAEMEELCKNGKYLDDISLERYETIKKIICNKKNTIILDNQKKEYYSAISGFTEELVNYDAITVLHQLKEGEKIC